LEGLELVDGICLPKCEEGQELNELKTECVPIASGCGENQTEVAGECACSEGFMP